ncbi:DUF393 domain-containing protein [Bacillus sp. FSL W7-1360]
MATEKVIVFYDGWCSFCKKSVAHLRKWDRRGRLQFLSFREEGITERYGLNVERLEQRMHTYELDKNRVREGIHSIRVIARQVPRLRAFVPLLWVASVIGLGQFVYDQIAARRTILPTGGCEDGVCQVPSLQQQKEEDG